MRKLAANGSLSDSFWVEGVLVISAASGEERCPEAGNCS